MSEPCSVQVTTATADEAALLGRLAVDGRLAACAQVAGPVTSTYRWGDEVTCSTEWVCTLKTTTARVEQLTELVRRHHSYELPEIVAVPIVAGDPEYLAWIEAESTPDR